MVIRKLHVVFLLCLTVLSACATPPSSLITERDNVIAYAVDPKDPHAEYSPVFLVREGDEETNRIGTPVVVEEGGKTAIVVSPKTASVYVEERKWEGSAGTYTNLLYRIHFQEIPFSLIPFHLGYGKNVGLFVIVTLDGLNRPILYTTLHTCGCYLAFMPTTLLDRELFPPDWPKERQYIFGENLPSLIPSPAINDKVYFVISPTNHRVEDAWVAGVERVESFRQSRLNVVPMEALMRLPTPQGTSLSFFETRGDRKDYVVGSQKLWERILISWWAFDWRVGEDKRLGRDKQDGIVFYTSLKPWARKASDLRDFASFMDYWGWNL